MRVTVNVSTSFKRQAKPLLKRYVSLKDELAKLETELIANPRKGIPLGIDAYKIKLAVKSKQRGKSGGLRVITYLETEIIGLIESEGDNLEVILISIFDKKDTANISDKELRDLIKQIHGR